MMHPEGETATAKAADKLGIPFILSMVSSRSIEDVAGAMPRGGPRFLHIYW